jgi:peptide deformylase
MIRDIYEFPSPGLERVMPEVKVFSAVLSVLLNDLKETMLDSNAVGLAANQIGVELRVCVTRIRDSNRVFEFINPVIMVRQGRIWSPEGCLSLPNYHAIIPRSKDIKVGYRTRENKVVMVTLADGAAVRLQHEIDHLDGILISDYVDGKKGKSGGINATKGALIN